MKIENLSLSFGLQTIFDDVSITINENAKVGVVGVNGAGKSTLFKIIIGAQEPSSGRIITNKINKIAFLPQVISDEIPNMNISVFDFLLTGRPIKKLESRQIELYKKISLANNTETKVLDKELKNIQSELDYYEQYSAENELLKIIAGMKIDDELLYMKLKELSGGQKSKIAFARLLYSKPETMLLDEPTNHLDKSSEDYIINYLKNYEGSVLVISHDNEFLDKITNTTLYINKLTHKMEIVKGNYSQYKKIVFEREKAKLNLLEKQNREEEKLKKIIAKYIRGNEKKANIAKDRQKKLARLLEEKVVIDKHQEQASFDIKMNISSGLIPLKVDNICFSYTNKPLITNLSFELSRGEKFLIVGENGVGKSTLLKLIIKKLIPSSGIININQKVEIAYYAQEHELLDSDKTIIENMSDTGLDNPKLRSILGSFLFHGDDIYKKVKILSPGERSRVALAKISLSGANFLILDEPTNHLDSDTQKIIANTFKNYKGTMLVVSHNTEFIDNLGISRILILPSGNINYYDKNIVLHYEKINSKE